MDYTTYVTYTPRMLSGENVAKRIENFDFRNGSSDFGTQNIETNGSRLVLDDKAHAYEKNWCKKYGKIFILLSILRNILNTQ